MSGDEPAFSATGDRVRIAIVTTADIEPYRVAVAGSAQRLAQWNPVNPADIEYHLRHQSAVHRTFIIHALDDEGSHGIVGRVNVTNIMRGRAMSATLGYDAYDPYAGRGLFLDGLRLVIDVAFAAEPEGLGLHRLEACVQPGNIRSASVVRALGFRARGEWPSYLWLPDADGTHAWRDHVIYGLLEQEWPSAAYPESEPVRPMVLVPFPGEPCASRLARALNVPLISADIARALGESLTAALIADCPGCVFEVPDRAWAARLGTALGWSPQDIVDLSVADLALASDPAMISRIALLARARALLRTPPYPPAQG